tara:strand:- start:2566 stop:3534 length:969 start_codon:yes stop_codon:yes gene_type:complete
MKVLITGVAGFIGFSVAKDLLKKNFNVIGVDNLNNYYSQNLKNERVKYLKKYKNFLFLKKNCSDNNFINLILKNKKISLVIHLAAEVGVRNSFSNPHTYYKNNIEAFFNILEICKMTKSNLIFASSSSVYGESKKKYFQEIDETSKPISFYAATKKSNEVMAYAYAKNYNISAIGIRFFNVYGPWGRPDMSIYKFTNLILSNKKITLFGSGKQVRDFTYIDDVVDLVNAIIKKYKNKKNFFTVFNSGKGQCINILNLIKLISKKLEKKAQIQKKDKHLGDVSFTNSSSKKLNKILKINPKIDLNIGIDKFLKWYSSKGKYIK